MKARDLTGKRFGRLIAQYSFKNESGRRYWHCICDCGGETDVLVDHLTRNVTQSCGCLQAEMRKTLASRREKGGCKLPDGTLFSELCSAYGFDVTRHQNGRYDQLYDCVKQAFMKRGKLHEALLEVANDADGCEDLWLACFGNKELMNQIYEYTDTHHY